MRRVTALGLLVACTAVAQPLPQGMSVPDLMRPWLQGDFDRAAKLYGIYTAWQPELGSRFTIDMQLELGHYRQCAQLLKDAGHQRDDGFQMRRARLLYATGDLKGAEAIVLEADLRHAGRVGLHLSNTLALILLERGQFSKAADQFKEKLKVPARQSAKVDEAETILALNGLALAHAGMNDLNVAAGYASRALELSTNSWGESSIPSLDALSALGRIRIEQHDFSRAHELLEKCATARARIYATAVPKIAEVLDAEAKYDMLTGNRGEALQLAARALQIRQEIASENPWIERKLQSRDQACGAQSYWPARALLTAGNAYAASGNYDMAEKCFDNAIPILEATLGADAPVVRQARARRATLRPTPGAVSQ